MDLRELLIISLVMFPHIWALSIVGLSVLLCFHWGRMMLVMTGMVGCVIAAVIHYMIF